MDKNYELIDSGGEEKVERFGEFVLRRPCSQAVWKRGLKEQVWDGVDALFSREDRKGWRGVKLPESWVVEHCGVKFKIKSTDFGHVGLFPEHGGVWEWVRDRIQPGVKVLNLFAYTGGATLVAAQSGAAVCHVDASKGTVSWARENAELNGLTGAPIRWIVDDVIKFLRREVKRGNRYDGIILDPPSFGRGAQGEMFKIEKDLDEILRLCRELLTEKALFVVLSCHTPGYTPVVMRYLMEDMMIGRGGKIEEGEMEIRGKKVRGLPTGTYARWSAKG